MGVSYGVKVSVGIEALKLVEEHVKTVYKTKYNEDTGEPYHIPITETYYTIKGRTPEVRGDRMSDVIFWFEENTDMVVIERSSYDDGTFGTEYATVGFLLDNLTCEDEALLSINEIQKRRQQVIDAFNAVGVKIDPDNVCLQVISYTC